MNIPQLTPDEAREVGKQLIMSMKEKGKGTTKEEAVKEFIGGNEALSQLVAKHIFIEALICAVVDNKLHKARTVQGSAASLGEEDGKKIGESLAMTMASTLTAKHAVDEWLLQFPGLLEVMRECSWVKPMLQ